MESKIIASFIKPICSSVYFFQSQGEARKQSYVIYSHKWSGTGRGCAQRGSSGHYWPTMLENEEKRGALAVQLFREEGYLSIENQKRGGIFSKGTAIRRDPFQKNGQTSVWGPWGTVAFKTKTRPVSLQKELFYLGSKLVWLK